MKRKHTVLMVDHPFLKKRWPEVEKSIDSAFSGSKFIGRGTVEGVINNTKANLEKPERKEDRHVVALDKNGEIVGACFSVPLKRGFFQRSSGLGWFFTSPELSTRERVAVADEIFDRVHAEMGAAGFKKIITSMGTEEGAKYLSKRFGYVQKPTRMDMNRWEKKL